MSCSAVGRGRRRSWSSPGTVSRTCCAGNSTSETDPGMPGSPGSSPPEIRSGTATTSSASAPVRCGAWRTRMRMPGCRAACSAVMDRSARGSQLCRPRQATASPGMSPAWVNPSRAGRDVIGSAQVNKKEPGRAVETEGPRGASGPAGMLAGVGRLARCGWPGGAPREARASKDLRFRRRSCGARWIEACACAQDADPPVRAVRARERRSVAATLKCSLPGYGGGYVGRLLVDSWRRYEHDRQSVLREQH